MKRSLFALAFVLAGCGGSPFTETGRQEDDGGVAGAANAAGGASGAKNAAGGATVVETDAGSGGSGGSAEEQNDSGSGGSVAAGGAQAAGGSTSIEYDAGVGGAVSFGGSTGTGGATRVCVPGTRRCNLTPEGAALQICEASGFFGAPISCSTALQCAQPVTHTNGYGGTWLDCTPDSTWDETQAMRACAAFTGDVNRCSVYSGCGPSPVVMGANQANSYVYWGYVGALAGYANGACPNSASTQWG